MRRLVQKGSQNSYAKANGEKVPIDDKIQVDFVLSLLTISDSVPFFCQGVDEVPIHFKRFNHNPQSEFLWASFIYVLGNVNVSHVFACTAQSSFRQRSGKDSFMSAVIVRKAFERIFRLY